MAQALADKIAVVTGGASGIGRAIAAGLLAAGADVAVVDAVPADLALLRRSAGRSDRRCSAWRCDALSSADVARTCRDIAAQFGVPTILVNNVGGSGDVAIEQVDDMTDDAWDRVLALNLGSIMRFCRALVPAMRAARHGRIVNLSSTTRDGLFGPVGTVGARLAYVAAKSAVVGLTRQLAKDLGPHGITVNAVAPGLTIAGEDARIARRFRGLPPEAQRRLTAPIPAGRLGSGEDIANAVCFLAAPASSYVNGEVLTVAGGA